MFLARGFAPRVSRADPPAVCMFLARGFARESTCGLHVSRARFRARFRARIRPRFACFSRANPRVVCMFLARGFARGSARGLHVSRARFRARIRARGESRLREITTISTCYFGVLVLLGGEAWPVCKGGGGGGGEIPIFKNYQWPLMTLYLLKKK